MMMNESIVKYDEPSAKLSWRLYFEDKILREEFAAFMMNTIQPTNMMILIAVVNLLFFFPLSCVSFFFSDLSMPLPVILISLRTMVSLATGVVGTLLCFHGFYSALSSAKRIHKYIPYINALFIILMNINNIVTVLHLVFRSHLCDTTVTFSRLYCEEFNYASLLTFIPSTPLSLIIALKDHRADLICVCSFIVYLFCVFFALRDKQFTFVLHLTVWSTVNWIVFMDVHFSRITKFLQQRKLQVALNRIEEMQAADRETELRHMIGNVAHDLKTPLSSIATAIEMIVDEIQQLKQQVVAVKEESTALHKGLDFVHDCLKSAQNTTKFMFMTINRCIDYTKASKGIRLIPKLETVNLLQALQVPLDCIHNIQEKIDIVCKPFLSDKHDDEDNNNICPYIITDKQWLQENLLCLLSNAVKYSMDGVVTVSVKMQSFVEVNKKSLQNKIPIPASAVHISATATATNKQSSMSYSDLSSFFGYAKINPSSCKDEEPEELVKMEEAAEPDDRSISLFNQSMTFTTFLPFSPSQSLLQEDAFYLCYEVEDNGIGLSEDMMGMLFNPFKQAQRLAGGTGLGLYSLAKRMDAIHGFYGVHSRNDGQQGSVFWFAIPYRPDTVMASYDEEVMNNNNNNQNKVISPSLSLPPRSPFTSALLPALTSSVVPNTPPPVAITPLTAVTAVAEETSQRHKILLVDDSPTIIRMMSMMLTRQGYDVLIAENGVIALETIIQTSSSSSLSLILMDMQMPILDGIETTKRLRMMEQEADHHNNAPLIVIGMSANSDEETKQAALLAGVNEFVTKPISMEVYSQLFKKYILTVPTK